ncbi:hypothetical protein [Ligilactobacillus pobuzihii]|uniref:Uncharacterized protein n=1 Tax=Ligilactobacillus pobuzihii TaxID=449659 RepID=A0A0R2LC41_9LACO|nr:hypothetical protein [Ligilactobacillus pobuzihii]KRK10928.1 hypothetical protein FD11_GL001197 [Ligilactobacillus pobuzihii E100301 = KCTC 13174]KRN99474.1 hypothetical protein IV66_GL001477 [Ligilactobacillus pobuzihii]GEN48910.1 hypothetical protein LPO01_17020 [Ligilactobacillus pobuzihii]
MKEVTSMQAAKQALVAQNKQGEILVDVINHVEGIEKEMKKTAKHVEDIAEESNKNNQETRHLVEQNVDNVYLSRGQLRQVRKVVTALSNKFARAWIENNHGKNYGGGDYLNKKIGQFRSTIWHALKEHFNTDVYTEIRRIDYNNALRFVNSLTISSFEAWRVKDRLTTLDTLNKWENSKGFPLTQPE